MRGAEKTKSVPAVDRAFTILELLATSKRGLSLSDLVEQTRMPKSSVHCLVLTLERRGYLYRHEKSGRYLLGLQLFGLANYANGGLELRDRAAPVLAQLMKQTSLTVHMAVLENDEPVLVSKVDSPGIFRLATWLGKRMDFHCTALGKAMAAFLPEATVERMIAAHGLPRHNENTIVCDRKLRQELKEARNQGYAVDDEEEEIGLRCIGAPIFDAEGNVVAAISIAGPASQIGVHNLPFLAARVKRSAASITEGLRASAAAAQAS